MGEFNIYLVNSDTNPEVSEFFDNLYSHFFAPYILQPTRLAKNCKTFFIFINSKEFGSNILTSTAFDAFFGQINTLFDQHATLHKLSEKRKIS